MSDKDRLIATHCPVCHHSVATEFYDGGDQALATHAWPQSSEIARSLQKFPQKYLQCPSCSLVWNHLFTEDSVPYESSPNRMFNRGIHWKGHLAETRDLILEDLPPEPTIIDIGCGEGVFINGLAEALHGRGRFIGFDPNTRSATNEGVEFWARYYDPIKDTVDLRPDVLVIRHVMEHMSDPTAFIERLAWGSSSSERPVWLFVEVPCIDRVFETQRLSDFFYEHPMHFSTRSFTRLMEKAGDIKTISHGYDGEVIYGYARLHVPSDHQKAVDAASQFLEESEQNRNLIRVQLDQLATSGKRVAIWGGTGKAAAFIHQFELDERRFPLVVDSDAGKAGTYVPGMGQKIQFRDVLVGQPLDTIIIPTPWRAWDIVTEMESESIRCDEVLIEHRGHLIDFRKDDHPYKKS